MQNKTRLWLGVGSAILIGGLSGGEDEPSWGKPVLAQAHGGHQLEIAQGGEGGGGGEGGEGGEGGNQAATTDEQAMEPDLALTSNLLLMRGHMLVADELIQAGRWSEALPHLLHPIEELYAEVREPLADRDLPPFGDALDELARTARKGGDAAAYAKQRDAVLARIDQALASVPAEKRQSPGFVTETALALLETAADEYEAAFEDGKIVNVVEYQDSLGFLREATLLFESNRAAFTGKQAERLAEIQTQLAELAKAWPSVQPPPQPTKQPGEVLALVSGIELSASGLH